MPGGRGGRRVGRVGGSYPNRSDLRTPPAPMPVTTVPNQPYGVAGQQAAAQQMVPMAAAPVVTPPAGPPAASTVPPAAAGGPPPLQPGQLGAFTRPTERPSEPVTAGMPFGPGPGPEALGIANPTEDELRALYRIAPNEDLRELLEDYDTGTA